MNNYLWQEHIAKSAWVKHMDVPAQMAKVLKPAAILEIGVYFGGSLGAFIKAFPDATIVAVDHFQTSDGGTASQVAHGIAKGEKVTFFKSLTEVKSGQFDIIHIDGDHSYAAVKADFEAALQLLAPHGFIMFHDTLAKINENFGVWRFWEELQTRPGWFAHHQVEYGLGIYAPNPDETLCNGLKSVLPALTNFVFHEVANVPEFAESHLPESTPEKHSIGAKVPRLLGGKARKGHGLQVGSESVDPSQFAEDYSPSDLVTD